MASHGDPLPIRKAIIKNGGSIVNEAGTAIISVDSSGNATLTGTETIVASEVALARGNVLVGNSSGVGVALDANDSGKILVGDGTDLASVAVSGDATLAANGALTVTDVTVGSDAAGDLLYKSSASALTRLAKGTAGQVLQMNSGATAPQWASISGDATIADGGALTVTDLTLGSDAAGDTFYKTSATVTARLAKGTSNQMYHMNSGATAPEWVSPLAGLVESTTATATADGLTTGAITALTGLKKFVTVTSANATDAITLPGISNSTIGQEIFLTVGANGYELLTVAGSNVTINQVDSDGTNQLDVAANTTVRCTQISGTAWLAETIAATTISITAPDND